MTDVGAWTFEKKLSEAVTRSLPRLGPQARAQLEAIVTPEALGIVAGVLVAWAISHAFGIGEAIDIILGVAGALSIGTAAFSGLDQFGQFARRAHDARTTADLDAAADHLAQAITILGVQAVLLMLFRGRPSIERVPLGDTVAPRAPGVRYRPKTTYEPLPPGVLGETSPWGDITISTLATAAQRDTALLHEAVHRFFSPKVYLLRDFRIENTTGSYSDSSLWRYIEEALAQTIALVGTRGFSQLFVGVSFPVKNGYLYLVKAGDVAQELAGKGLLPESAGLIAGGFATGVGFRLWLKSGSHPTRGRR